MWFLFEQNKRWRCVRKIVHLKTVKTVCMVGGHRRWKSMQIGVKILLLLRKTVSGTLSHYYILPKCEAGHAKIHEVKGMHFPWQLGYSLALRQRKPKRYLWTPARQCLYSFVSASTFFRKSKSTPRWLWVLDSRLELYRELQNETSAFIAKNTDVWDRW